MKQLYTKESCDTCGGTGRIGHDSHGAFGEPETHYRDCEKCVKGSKFVKIAAPVEKIELTTMQEVALIFLEETLKKNKMRTHAHYRPEGIAIIMDAFAEGFAKRYIKEMQDMTQEEKYEIALKALEAIIEYVPEDEMEEYAERMGLEREECLEMSYGNVRTHALGAIIRIRGLD